MPNSQIRLVLGLPRALDRAALASLLNASPGFKLLAAETRLSDVVSLCRTHAPDAVVVDGTYPFETAVRSVRSLLQSGASRAAAILDDSFAIARAFTVLEIPGCCYCTRSIEVQELHQTITHVLARTQHDPKSRLHFDSANERPGTQSLIEHDQYGLLALSKREREVMSLFARGYTVDRAAERLGLAHSTIDNHKTRILKKLNVHRTIDMVRIAFSAGLVDCNDAQWRPQLACAK